MRGSAVGKNKHFVFFRMIRRPHVPRTRYQVFIQQSNISYCCRCTPQQVPRWCCCTKKVPLLESSHGHHLPARAGSARAARGRCFDPKRAAMAPGCRACSASREHRVGSLLIVSMIKLRLTAAVVGGARRQLLTMAHIHRIVRPRCRTESSWLRAGREHVCLTASICVLSS